jgi:hypothetical protein
MPRVSDVFDRRDVDAPGSRFSVGPAIALSVPEEEWADGNTVIDGGAEAALVRHLGDWIFQNQDELGRGEAIEGSMGRGAAGYAAVLEFVAVHAAGGVISAAAGIAFARFVKRAQKSAHGDGPSLFVSRGGAAYLAAAEVAARFGAPEAIEVEAVEEPSYIAGREVSELSYVGVEPWIVLLRAREKLRRYIVVVAANGDVLGALETPMGEWEKIYLPSPEESDWVRPPGRRRRWPRRR